MFCGQFTGCHCPNTHHSTWIYSHSHLETSYFSCSSYQSSLLHLWWDFWLSIIIIYNYNLCNTKVLKNSSMKVQSNEDLDCKLLMRCFSSGLWAWENSKCLEAQTISKDTRASKFFSGFTLLQELWSLRLLFSTPWLLSWGTHTVKSWTQGNRIVLKLKRQFIQIWWTKSHFLDTTNSQKRGTCMLLDL